jgi:pyruvate dehydrogenase (quinone)
MAKTVADFLLERLSGWGVRRIYGYPGDGINGLLGALNRAGDRFEFVQARHEEMAAFEAVGYGRFTGRVGVCTATSGPGAIHLLNGLYDAKLEPMHVVLRRGKYGGQTESPIDEAGAEPIDIDELREASFSRTSRPSLARRLHLRHVNAEAV